jgi:DNA repair exonuclease SbcCD ATPase subunit
MIEENDNSRFQFSADEDEPEAILQDELQELKIEKLGQRVTLLTILIPCMIGVILVITYLDIKDRVTQSHDTGAIGVQKLSKDLASKFSSLSLEQAKIKDIQAKKLPELEKSAAFLKSRMTKIQESMNQISASAINRTELTRVNKTLTDKLADIPQDLKPDFEALALADEQIIKNYKKISSDIKVLSDKMMAIDTSMNTIRKEIETLSENAINKDDLELALKLKEIGYRQELLDKTALLEKEIQSVRKEINGLQKTDRSSSGVAPAAQPSAPVSESDTIKPATDKSENSLDPLPPATESGGIVEQTIEE